MVTNLKIAGQEFDIETAQKMVDAGLLGTGYKHDPSTTVSNWAPAHGPGGLFSGTGVRPDMYSTVPRPIDLSRVIPIVYSNYENEIYEILTGQTVTEGTRAADICSEGPMAGKLKVCRQVISFGTGKLDTSVERLTTFGRRIDRADLDRNVLNLATLENPLMPDVLNTNNVNTNTGKLLYENGLAWERSYSLMDIQGVATATSNAADFNVWIAQFDGLDRMIRTGYVDMSASLVACPAADSVVTTHNAPIGSAGTNGQTFIANVVNSYRAIKQRAQIIGMGDFEAAIVMHPNAAWAVYDQWACAYNTDRCTGSAGNPVPQNATDVVQFRDTMRRGAYLLIDGEAVPVLFSSGMQWAGSANNTFITDIFIVPLRWAGRPLLYRQAFPLSNADAMQWIETQPNAPVRIINGGLYAVGMRTTNGFCSKIELITRTRLILDTPFLAARINDVSLTYAIDGYDAYVGQSNYKDGGQSSRYNPR